MTVSSGTFEFSSFKFLAQRDAAASQDITLSFYSSSGLQASKAFASTTINQGPLAAVTYTLDSPVSMTSGTYAITLTSSNAANNQKYTVSGFNSLLLTDGTSSLANISVDSFTVGDSTLSIVPEPHEYAALASLGLLGFAVVRRVKQRRTSLVAA